MEEIFIEIMEQIAREMPELSLIDEDYGQLEMGAEEDHYPVTFHCWHCSIRFISFDFLCFTSIFIHQDSRKFVRGKKRLYVCVKTL